MPKPYDSGDNEHVNAARDKAAFRAARVLNGFKQAVDTQDGRAFVYWLLEQSGVFHNEFHGNSRDYYNNGKRAIGTVILDHLRAHAMTQYFEMLKEHRND